jgi:hypothetical protein
MGNVNAGLRHDALKWHHRRHEKIAKLAAKYRKADAKGKQSIREKLQRMLAGYAIPDSAKGEDKAQQDSQAKA